MNQLNSLVIEGNIVRNAESKVVASGKKLCTFTLAHNRGYKKADGTIEEKTSFFDCEAWEKLAEAAAKNALKGIRARIVGRLDQNAWSDAEGKRHSQVKIVCESTEYFTPPKSKEEKPEAKERGAERTEQRETQAGSFDIPF